MLKQRLETRDSGEMIKSRSLILDAGKRKRQILDARFLTLVNNSVQEDTESNLHKFGSEHITNQDPASRIKDPEPTNIC